MKKTILILAILLVMVGCQNQAKKAPDVITTSFITYDLTKHIAPDLEVELLVKPGQNLHGYEPTAQDMMMIEDANIFIYTNPYMEPWVASLVTNNKNIIDASQNIQYLESDHTHDQDDEHDHDHGTHDPHVWTSMKNVKIMVDTITDALIETYPNSQDLYQENADELLLTLDSLDQGYRKAFEQSDIETLVFLGHFGLNYLMHDYGFHYLALFESMSHESEPTIGQLQTIMDTIDQLNLEYVFVEELSELKIVDTIETETGVKTLELNSLHNVSKEQFENGITFIDIQKQNIENLKIGLKQ